jgi:hypothetical protein
MTDLIDLERRVTALEAAQKETAETQTWMAATLGRIAAVQDTQGRTLEDHTQRLDRIEADLKGLRGDLPTMLAEAVREGLKDKGQ